MKKFKRYKIIVIILTILLILSIFLLVWINIVHSSNILEFFKLDLLKTIGLLAGIFYVSQKIISKFTTKQDKYILEILDDLYRSLDKILSKLYVYRASLKDNSVESVKINIGKIADEINTINYSCSSLKDFIVSYRFNEKIYSISENLSKSNIEIKNFMDLLYHEYEKNYDEIFESSFKEKMELTEWEYKIKDIKNIIRALAKLEQSSHRRASHHAQAVSLSYARTPNLTSLRRTLPASSKTDRRSVCLSRKQYSAPIEFLFLPV